MDDEEWKEYRDSRVGASGNGNGRFENASERNVGPELLYRFLRMDRILHVAAATRPSVPDRRSGDRLAYVIIITAVSDQAWSRQAPQAFRVNKVM